MEDFALTNALKEAAKAAAEKSQAVSSADGTCRAAEAAKALVEAASIAHTNGF